MTAGTVLGDEAQHFTQDGKTAEAIPAGSFPPGNGRRHYASSAAHIIKENWRHHLEDGFGGLNMNFIAMLDLI
jgi:hypothetical protein